MEKKKYNRIKLKLDKQKKYIEKELKKVLSKISAPKTLKEVMLYSVFNGGKKEFDLLLLLKFLQYFQLTVLYINILL